MRVAGEISLDSGPLQLHQNIQVFGGSSHISHRTFKHRQSQFEDINFTHSTVLLSTCLVGRRAHICHA